MVVVGDHFPLFLRLFEVFGFCRTQQDVQIFGLFVLDDQMVEIFRSHGTRRFVKDHLLTQYPHRCRTHLLYQCFIVDNRVGPPLLFHRRVLLLGKSVCHGDGVVDTFDGIDHQFAVFLVKPAQVDLQEG